MSAYVNVADYHAAQKTQDSDHATETVKQDSVKTTHTIKDQKHMSETGSIMDFSEDLATAEAPPPLPAGEYPASIVKAEIKDSAKGNKYLALMFRIEPESYPADFQDGNPEGETLAYNRVVLMDTPQGRYRARKFCESVGYTLSRQIDPNELMGLTATVGVVMGKWEGEDRAEIAKVIAA